MAVELGMNFLNGVAYAMDAHQGQVRKGSNVPYVTHALAVALLVLEFGGDEDQAIGGLLHDVIEDCDPVYAERMQETFGARVYAIVRGMTDGVPDENGVKPEWRVRKEAYLAALRQATPDVLLVKACDGIHNARSTIADVRRDGLAAFKKFRGGVEGTIWYYREIAKAVVCTAAGAEMSRVAEELATLAMMAGLVESEGGLSD